MKTSQLQNRNFNLDLIRILAFTFIPSVHFFLRTFFYNNTTQGTVMITLYFVRNLFLLGLPLFMLLTGFLQGNKQPGISGKYFLKITKFLAPYIIITLFFILVDAFYFRTPYSFGKVVASFTTFKNYSWYVEMYIGLFLLIPFFNMMWSCFKKTSHEIVFLCILISITLLPSFFNSFSFGGESLLRSENKVLAFIPDWWTNFYPITYYFTGAFLSKHKDSSKLKAVHYFIFFILSFAVTNVYHLMRDYGRTPIIRGWLYWDSITLFIPAVFLFMFIASINFRKIPNGIRRISAKLSDLSFGAYMASIIPDLVIYPIYNQALPYIYKVLGFPVVVLLIIIISFIISFIADLIYKGSVRLIHKIIQKKGVNHG